MAEGIRGDDGTWRCRGVEVGEELILHEDPRLDERPGAARRGRRRTGGGHQAVRGELRRGVSGGLGGRWRGLRRQERCGGGGFVGGGEGGG